MALIQIEDQLLLREGIWRGNKEYIEEQEVFM
jgi:hypothetical protein